MKDRLKYLAYGFAPITPVPPATGTVPAETAVSNIVTNIITLLFLLGGIAAILYLLWAGIQYITSAGNPEKMKSARQSIIAVVVGIVVMMAAWFIIRLAVSLGLEASRADQPTTLNQNQNPPKKYRY
jgi:type VI protein secretion system component VasK